MDFQTKRVFLALPLEPVQPALEHRKLLEKMLSSYYIRWVGKENYHLTFYFFGEVQVKKIPLIKNTLHSALDSLPAFDYVIKGTGIFKRGKEPQVLWFGFEKSEKLEQIKDKVDEALSTIGFLSDKKAFVPHLTIGRFQPQQMITGNLNRIIKMSQSFNPLVCSASEMILYESRLFPSGARYTPLEVFSFLT